jgi:cobalt-zinc-cadmium efflux system protein
MLGSVGAIAAALVMLATGWYLADPLLSAGIGMLILWGAWRLLRESVDVLLEATPRGIDPDAVRDAMASVPGVVGVHDLHVWTVTSGILALSSHVEVTPGRAWNPVLIDLCELLRERFGIAHVTLQPEEPHAHLPPLPGCAFDTPRGRAACIVPAPAGLGAARHGHAGHRH